MKTYCFECKHDCHCGRKCNQCSCYICNNIVIKTYEDYMGGNIIRTFFKKWLIGLFIIFLLFLYSVARADTVTTGNLLPNAGDGVDWGSTSTEQINPGGSGTVTNGSTLNGFDVTCPASQVNCGYKYSVGGDLEVTGTTTLSANDIPLTNNTRTQEMLDNGITLNSYVDVANCDSQPGNCEGRSGNADSHTVTIELKDSLGNVLSTTTQTRTEVVGFQGNCNGYPSSNSGGQTANCGQYNDQVIYNNHGSNKVDWSWSGTDNNTGSGQRGGPNLLGAALTMTYDDTVIDNSIIEDIGDIFENIEDIIEDEITFQEIKDMFEDMVEFFDAPPPMQEMIEEDFQEMTFEPVMIMEEMLMEEEMMIEEMPIEQMPMEEDVKPSFFAMTGPEQEEIYQETEELITEFLPPPPPTEEMPMEEEMVEDEPVMEEEMIEEEPKTMAAAPKEKEEVVEEKQEEVIEESKEEIIEESNEEEITEEKPTSETPAKSIVQTKKIAKQKAIQQKKALVKNLARVMEKVDKDIKNISKNLQIKNIIKMEAMTTDQASLDKYQATSFYKPKNIYLDQLNLMDNRLIYADKSLATYIQNDKMDIKARKLREINTRKQQILMELEVLKNG
jgi:hypothetical protein